MPDEITIKPKSDSESPSSPPAEQSVTLSRRHLMNLCAAGLGVSFFLPWANLLLATPSGYDLQNAGDQQRLLWAIPIFSLVTLLAGLAKQNQAGVARFTGLLPFLVGGYWLHQMGKDLLHVLAFGAYLSLLFGAGLLILAGKSK